MAPPFPIMLDSPHLQLTKRTVPNSPTTKTSTLSIVEAWLALLSRLSETTATIKHRYDERSRVERQISARVDDWCTDIFLQTHTRLSQLTSQLEMQLTITQKLGDDPSSTLQPFALTPWQMEERFRALIQMQSFLGSFFERASPAYDQSKTVWWFDPSYHLSDGLNYDRYGAPDVRELEARFLQALALGGGSHTPLKLLLTSSGVAAFTVLHQFLMSKVLGVGDVIVTCPYLYFECYEHLRQISHAKVITSATFDALDIIETAEKHNAKAVYLDPMANTVGLETTDLRHFAQLLAGRPGWSERFLIIDGTLISGGMALYDWFAGEGYPKVLYYESAHKYIQMGMDIVMLGLLVYPEEYHDTLGLIRQVTGTTLYSRQANVLPLIDYSVHQSRMHWLTSNAERLYHILDKGCSSLAKFRFPLHWRSMGWSHGGNVVTIRLYGGPEMNKRPSLDAFTALVLRAAEEEGVAATKGGGLGFSVTRVWPSTPFIRNEDPYMRISVGVDPGEIEGMARAIAKGLERHCGGGRDVVKRWKGRENGQKNGWENGQKNGWENGTEGGIVKMNSSYMNGTT